MHYTGSGLFFVPSRSSSSSLRLFCVAPFDLDRGLDDFVVVSSMTDNLQASGQEATPATHRNCSNGIASQIERSRGGHERETDTLTASRPIAVRQSLACATDSAEHSPF